MHVGSILDWIRLAGSDLDTERMHGDPQSV